MAGSPQFAVELNNNTIVYNSIDHSGGSGVRVNAWAGKSSVLGTNNIIYFNTSNTKDNNQCSSEAGSIDIVYSSVLETMPGDGNIVDDPLFVNADKDDYHLSAQSPCINTGNPSLPSDLDDSRSDMGALPYLDN